MSQTMYPDQQQTMYPDQQQTQQTMYPDQQTTTAPQANSPPADGGAWIRDTEAEKRPKELRLLDTRGPQNVVCPFCKETTQAHVDGRSQTSSNWWGFCCWPLPNRRHYFEKTKWSCKNCNRPFGQAKYGEKITLTQEAEAAVRSQQATETA